MFGSESLTSYSAVKPVASSDSQASGHIPPQLMLTSTHVAPLQSSLRKVKPVVRDHFKHC